MLIPWLLAAASSFYNALQYDTVIQNLQAYLKRIFSCSMDNKMITNPGKRQFML